MSYLESLTNVSLNYSSVHSEIIKSIDEIQEGNSQDENFLYFRNDGNIKVYNRICDHNGGRLSLSKSGAMCPLHGWMLDLSNGHYINADCIKKPILEINEFELDSPLIFLPIKSSRLSMQNWSSEKKTEIRFINHACLIIRMGDITFATDPWIYGSAFCNGWWLDKSSPIDAFDALNDCDFIYISHNHPDHLHPKSLKKIRKDMTILTADFESGSTKEYLNNLGFRNVIAMDFASSFIDHEKEVLISVLKSGDFRDDSGLLFQHGKFKCLLTVDSNFLNFGKLPSVDLLCSSYAGGASGFPLCFENYTEEQKRVIITRKRGSIRAVNTANIKITEPKFFMPYAGFFKEAAERDWYIKQRNIKNRVTDYEKICKVSGSSLLDVNKSQMFVFEGSHLVLQKKDETEKMDTSSIGLVKKLNAYEVDDKLKSSVINYFEGCNFEDKLLVDLRPTSDDFQSGNIGFRLDFSSKDYSVFNCSSQFESVKERAINNGLRYLQIKVRRDELLDLVTNGKPWEDLLIGFQCRIYRMPNIYNSGFWFYFTNVYIGNKVPNI